MWTRRKRQGADGEGKAEKEKPTKTALVAATDMLARQDYSTRKLAEKLQRKGYEAEEIVAALRRLKELHYLDDAAACERQFRHLYEESRSSVRQIFVKLLHRGFSKETITSCVPEDTYERECEAALRTLRVKYKPAHDRQKMMASLYRSGFSGSAIRDAVESFQREAEEGKSEL